MKTITVNVSEPVYRDFQRHAATNDRTTSELIRDAMAEYRDRNLRRRGSLAELRSYSLGRMHRPLGR